MNALIIHVASVLIRTIPKIYAERQNDQAGLRHSRYRRGAGYLDDHGSSGAAQPGTGQRRDARACVAGRRGAELTSQPCSAQLKAQPSLPHFCISPRHHCRLLRHTVRGDRRSRVSIRSVLDVEIHRYTRSPGRAQASPRATVEAGDVCSCVDSRAQRQR